MKIVQLSDLHLTAGGEALFGSSPRERLELAIDSILQNHADADFCLLTGDLADAGSETAYGALADALRRLPMPAHLLLDTVETGAPWGTYCAGRQEWLARQLASAGDQPLYIAMHHPPLALGIPSMDQFALRDAEAFWAVIAPHRASIRHLFFGHLHRPIGGSWRGIPFSCAASPNHQVALDLATLRGDEVPGCREPAGYAVILIDTDRVVVHHQQLFNGETSFWL